MWVFEDSEVVGGVEVVFLKSVGGMVGDDGFEEGSCIVWMYLEVWGLL